MWPSWVGGGVGSANGHLPWWNYRDQQNALLTNQWLMVFAPGLAIALLALSFTLVNFGVDALSNPRLREKA